MKKWSLQDGDYLARILKGGGILQRGGIIFKEMHLLINNLARSCKIVSHDRMLNGHNVSLDHRKSRRKSSARKFVFPSDSLGTSNKNRLGFLLILNQFQKFVVEIIF